MAWPETVVFLCCSRGVSMARVSAIWLYQCSEVTVVYQNGLPVISVSLPSRRERCQFTLKPLSDCVGVFLQQLQAEDRGIDRVAIYSTDGARIASSTGIDILLLDDFQLVINDTTHLVRPPRRELLPHEEAERLNDVKFLVQQLYTTLRIEEHQLSKERELIGRLEDLNSQLRPLEKAREELGRKAERRTTWVLWGGMAYMATQFGILARLTWWEYSWDIMEPVTYFITYGTAMAIDRQYLLFFHKGVKRTRFDVEKYNKLKDDIAEVRRLGEAFGMWNECRALRALTCAAASTRCSFMALGRSSITPVQVYTGISGCSRPSWVGGGGCCVSSRPNALLPDGLFECVTDSRPSWRDPPPARWVWQSLVFSSW
ncbi:unnamed protein product [Tetraodon nigroviridis]|uniref:Calcium uniporter protein n=1 Tax=Tetraodon nigroviridis TaxID=99883 RepID=Q4RQ43_TETNG|nr:unnamed protein product [Tetraodon nigroviridis]